MEWYRRDLPLIRKLIDQDTLCGGCGRSLVEEGHQSVLELRVEQPDTPLRTLIPNFKLFAVYLVQCECGAWHHTNCLRLRQEQHTKTKEVVINGVRSLGLTYTTSVTCPSCGQPLWEISSSRPTPWVSELPVRLPPRISYSDFVRHYELFLMPHLTSWPSVLLRRRGQVQRTLMMFPYPKDGLLPSPGLITQECGWRALEKTVTHRIAREICTSEAAIKAALADHIAQRERSRVEREHIALARAATRDSR